MRDLDENLERWRVADLISPEQVEAITEFETAARPQRSSLIAEVLGYLGGALAIVALWVFIAEYWNNLQSWAQLALIGVLTLAFLAAGAWARTSRSEAVRRLASFLWFLAVAGIAGWFGVLSTGTLDVSNEAVALWITIPTFAVALVLWLALRKVLQVAALVGATHAVVLSALAQVKPTPFDWFGLVIWSIGIACVLLAWGTVLKPGGTSYGLGIAAILLGPTMASAGLDQAWPLWLGLLTAAALLVASISLREIVLLVGGAGAVFIFLPQLIFTYFRDTLGVPVALFLSGVLLIAAALLIARLKREVTGP
ncbi:MAG: DUF2157 domain-containing protein [Acidimicrobiia bacterium]